jgi:hypothetical protein
MDAIVSFSRHEVELLNLPFDRIEFIKKEDSVLLTNSTTKQEIKVSFTEVKRRVINKNPQIIKEGEGLELTSTGIFDTVFEIGKEKLNGKSIH